MSPSPRATPASTSSDWTKVQLHVVTGKGGTGKSTVAAALALALARSGRNVLLCEVEGRQGIARMFDVDPLPYEERRIAKGLVDDTGHAGQVHALHIDPESALLEYLSMYYKLGRAGKALDRFGVIDFATTIAPGVRDVLLTGKVYEAVQRPALRGHARSGQDKGRHPRALASYDAVVLDAPPTGRIAQFLGVNSELAGLAKMGPIKSQADKVMALLRSPRTAVHIVTVLEEMPVQETADGIDELRRHDLPVGGVIVNQVRPRDLGRQALEDIRDGICDHTEIAAELTRAKIDVDPELVVSLCREANDHAVRRELEDEQRVVVDGLGVPTYELPRLAGGVDAGGLLELAALMREQGLA